MLEIDDIADVVAGAVREATEPLLARIDALEKRELLLPEKGDPGADVDMAEVVTRIDMAVKSAVAALPAPKDGEPGKDGLGLADALRDAEGNLVLVMADGRTKSLGKIDGEPGKDGATFTLDDFDMVPLTERAFDFRFTKGGVCHSFEVKFDVPLYRGVFKEAGEYERGDMVTWAGSLWHCDEPKGLKPGAPDSGWTLAVKAGRPGRDAGK